VELLVAAKDIAKDEATDGISISVCTVIVELASIITSGNVDLGKVTLSSNLNVVGSLHKVYARKCASWDNTATVGLMRAIGNLLSFRVTNGILRGWTPDAKVVETV